MKSLVIVLTASFLMLGSIQGRGRFQQDSADINKARELYAKAMEVDSSENHDKVLAYCREAVKLYPAYIEAHRTIIDITRNRENLETEYRELVAKNPDNPAFQYLLGRVLEDPSEKEAAFREALRLDPRFAWGHLGLGSALVRKGLLEEAVAHYRKVNELDPRNESGYRGVALAYRLMGKPEMARDAYQQMIEALPDDPSGYLGLAAILADKLQAPDQASLIYRQAYERFRDDGDSGATILYQLAELTTEPSEKIELYQQLVDSYPQSSRFHIAYRMLLMHYKATDPERAERMARHALQMPSPPDAKRLKADAYETLFDIYNKQQRPDLEKALAEEILGSGFENPRLYQILGGRYADSAIDPEMALRFLKKALSLARAEYMLGTVAFGRYSDEGLEEIADRMRGSIHLQIGQLHLSQGRLPEAIEELTAAAASQEPLIQAPAVYHLGLAYEKSGRLDEALGAMVEAVILHKDDNAKADLVRIYQSKTGSLERLGASLLDYANSAASDSEGSGAVAADEPSLDEAILTARTLVSGQAPDFSLQTLDGQQFALAKLGSKAVVINFWATWCGPCLAEFPFFQKAYEKYQGRDDVLFLAISTEGPEALQTVRELIEKKGYTFPVALSSETAQAYGATAIPTLVVVGTQGRIQYRQVGFDSKATAEFVQKLSDRIEFTLGSQRSKD